MDSGEVDRLIVELAKTTARLGEAAAAISASKPSEGNAIAETKAPKGIVTDEQDRSLNVDKLLQGFEKILGDQFKKDSKSDDDRKKKSDKKKENQNDSPRRIQQKAQPITLVGFDRTALSQLGKVFGNALNSLKSKATPKSQSQSQSKGGMLGKLGLAGLLGAGALAAFTAGDEYWGISKLLARLSLEGGKWLKALTKSFSTAGMKSIKAGADFMKNLGDDMVKRIKNFFGLGKGAAKGGGFFAKVGQSAKNIWTGLTGAIKSLFGISGGAKAAGKSGVKTLAKSSLKWIPGFGLLIGLAFAYFEWKNQGWAKGWPYILGNIASGIASIFPGIGTGISIGIDVLMMMLKSQEKKQEEKTGKQVSGGGWFKLIGKTLWKLINPVLKFIPGIGTAVYLFEAWQAKDDVKKMVKKLALGLLALAPIPGLAVGTELLLHFLDKKKGEDPKTEKVPFSLKAFGKTIFDLVMNNFPVKNIMQFGKGVGQVVAGKFKEGFKNMAFAVPFLEAIYNWVSGPEPAAEGAQTIPEKKSWLGKALDWIGSAVKAILKGIAWPFKKVLEWLGWDMGNEKVSDSSIMDTGSPAPKPEKVSLWSKIGGWIGGFLKGTFLALTWPIRWVAKALGFFPDEKEIADSDFVDGSGAPSSSAPKVPLWKKILSFGWSAIKGTFLFLTWPVRWAAKALGFFPDEKEIPASDFADESGGSEQKAPKVSIWKKLLNFGWGLVKGAAKFIAWPVKKALQWMGFFKENEVEDHSGELGQEVDKQGWVGTLAGAIGSGISGAANFIGNGVKGAIDGAKAVWDTGAAALKSIGGWMSDGMTAAKEGAAKAWETGKAALKGIGDWVKGGLDGAKEFGKSALDAIGPGLKTLGDVASGAFNTALEVAGPALKGIGSRMTKMANEVADFFKTDAIRDAEANMKAQAKQTQAAKTTEQFLTGSRESNLALKVAGIDVDKGDLLGQIQSKRERSNDKAMEEFVKKYTRSGWLAYGDGFGSSQTSWAWVGKGKPPSGFTEGKDRQISTYQELARFLKEEEQVSKPGKDEKTGILQLKGGVRLSTKRGDNQLNRLTDIGKVTAEESGLYSLMEMVAPGSVQKGARRSEAGLLTQLENDLQKYVGEDAEENIAAFNLRRLKQAKEKASAENKEFDSSAFKEYTREDFEKMLRGAPKGDLPDTPDFLPEKPQSTLVLDSVPAETPEATTAQVVDKNNEAMQVAIKQMGSDIVEALEAAAKQYNESKGATIATRNNTTINNVTPAQAVPAGAVTMPASQQSQ